VGLRREKCVNFEFWSRMALDTEIGDANADAPESDADAGRAGGGMVIASSSRSSPLSLSRSR